MKHCPKCYRSYSDETLIYCLEDGSLLLTSSDREATQRIPASRVTTQAITEVLPSPLASASPSIPGRSRSLIIYGAIGLLALVAGGAMMAWMNSNSNTSTAAKSEAASNASPVTREEVSSDSSNSTREKESLQEEKERLEREREELAEERRKLEARQKESTSSTTKQLPPPPGGTYFVILGSFPRKDYEKASQRLQSMRGSGYDASLIDSDNYPGLSSGLWVVVIGPFAKSYAQNVAAQIKPARSDVYIKSGW